MNAEPLLDQRLVGGFERTLHRELARTIGVIGLAAGRIDRTAIAGRHHSRKVRCSERTGAGAEAAQCFVAQCRARGALCRARLSVGGEILAWLVITRIRLLTRHARRRSDRSAGRSTIVVDVGRRTEVRGAACCAAARGTTTATGTSAARAATTAARASSRASNSGSAAPAIAARAGTATATARARESSGASAAGGAS